MSKEAKVLSHKYIVPISVPSEVMRTSNPRDIVQNAVDFILLSTRENGSFYWRSEGRGMRKLLLGAKAEGDSESVSIAELEEEFKSAGLDMTDIINPAEEARFVLESTHYKNGKKAEQTKDPVLLVKSRQMVKEASDKILARFGEHLSPEHRTALNLLDQGVNVIPKLKNTQADLSSILENLLPKILHPLSKVIKDLYGEVVKPWIAVNYDEDYLKSLVEQEEKMHIIAHEAMHIIGDNNLPTLLNEAITDDLADEALGYSSNSQNRMGENFKYVCEIWKRIKAQSGTSFIIAVYTQPTVVRKTVSTRSKKTIGMEYLDHPFHDEMRRMFGQDEKGFRWDIALGLIEDKKGRKAYNYLFPEEKKGRRSSV